jgi:hypothetical protein
MAIWESLQLRERSCISRPNIQENCPSLHGPILGRPLPSLLSLYILWMDPNVEKTEHWIWMSNGPKLKNFLTTYFNNIRTFLGEILTFHIIRIIITVSLPRGWIQEIKRMEPDLLAHGLFLTWTQNLIIHWSYMYNSIYTSDEICSNPTPCPLSPSILLTWRTSFLACGANSHPLLSLVC